MTRKDYEAIANVIAEAVSVESDETGEMVVTAFIAAGLAGVLAADNPRFDQDRFLKACGL